ncbi:MAG: class I SAM-dependent methyltransferase [Alphaproteobacteria bacterium]|nr:class I SAM-dependent methyltransferase [Alphaproteobacteria bacterium]
MSLTNLPHRGPQPMSSLERSWRMLRLGYNLLRRRHVQRDVYALIYGAPTVRDLRFMNWGHWPLPADFIHHPAWAAEASQAAMYHLVLAEGAALLGQQPGRLLEVACGRAGGARYAHALLPDTRLTLLDLQPDAVLAAREVTDPARAEHLVAMGEHLPFAPDSFDMVITVEALMNLGRRAFMAECSKVLRPGGVLSVCGFHDCPGKELAPHLIGDAAVSGLQFHDCRDITPAVLEACQRDQERREDALRRGSRLGFGFMRNFAALPDTPNYRLFAERKRCYFLARFTRPV